MSPFSILKKTFFFIVLSLTTLLHVGQLQAACPTILSPPTLPNGIIGTPYSQTLTSSGGVAPYSFIVSSGSLPSGLVLNTTSTTTASISGTPTNAGAYDFTITVLDSASCSSSFSYRVIISCPNIALTPSTLPTGTTGVVYGQTLTASNGVGPYTFTVSSGSLPIGLVLNTTGVATGQISGIPAAAGTYTFNITVADTGSPGCSDEFPYTLIINCQTIAFTTSSPLTSGVIGMAYGPLQIGTSGGIGSLTFSVTSGTLPPGLILDAMSGKISGIPVLAGAYEFIITTTDSDGCMSSMPYILAVNCQTMSIITTSPLPAGATGTVYNTTTPLATIAVTGGVTPVTFSVTSGTLPPGLILNASGQIVGTPTLPGVYQFIVTAKDSDGCIAAMPYFLAINCPAFSITTAAVGTGIAGTPYTQTLAVMGGVSPITFSVTNGALPPELILNSATGTISGIPLHAGDYGFAITATDSDGCTASMAYDLIVNCPGITFNTASPLASGSTGVAYTPLTIGVSGAVAPVTFSVTSGTFPPGLVLNPATGTISGIPILAGAFEFVVTVTDGDGCIASKPYILVVNCSALSINTLSPLSSATTNATYSVTLNVTGGAAPLNFSVTSGTLPPGLALNATTGNIFGTPTLPGVYHFVITLKDSDGCLVAMPYTLVVNCPTTNIAITTATIPVATTGTVYTTATPLVTIGVANGVMPFTFTVTNGSLPPELILNPTNGQITGTPIHAGTYAFVINVTDSDGCTASMPYVLIVNCASLSITTPSLPIGITGTTYTTAIPLATIATSGGTSPVTFSVTSGALPPELYLNPLTGKIIGTPLLAGTYGLIITATDSDGCTASMPYVLIINCPTVSIQTVLLAEGETGFLYSQTISVTGGSTPYTFSVSSGSLPPGLLLNPTTGTIAGIPTAAGVYNFVVSVKDDDGCVAAMSYTIIVICPNVVIGTPSLASGQTGTPYSQTVTATGGIPPYTFNVVSGQLPPGLVLNSTTGVIFGIPTLAGVYNFTMTVTDTDGCMAIMPYTIIINCPTITLTTESIDDATTGVFYTESISATGGIPPYTYNVSSGMLPPGLVLNPITGTISGIPVINGTYEFVISVKDSDGCIASMPYIIIVSCPDIAITPATLPNGVAGATYTATLFSTGGTVPYTYSISSGVLPTGLLLDAITGVISGTPKQAGVFNFVVESTDSFGCTGFKAYSLIITCSDITITTTSPLPSGTTNAFYSEMIVATGTSQPFTYSLTGGTLPPGLVLNPSTGLIFGIPTLAGTYEFVITVTDTNGCSVSDPFILQIFCPTITVTPTTLANGSLGVPYPASAGTITATGGLAPYTFRVSAGSLPPGLLLDTTGPTTALIFGVPEKTGSYSFEIAVTDSFGCVVNIPYILTIVCPGGTFSALSPTTGEVGKPYTSGSSLMVFGGATYTYSISAGELPPGLILTGSGTKNPVISGVPIKSGTYNFTIRATVSDGCADSQHCCVLFQNYTITINKCRI